MEAQTKDEIEKIMSEIEDLRKEITATTPAEVDVSDVAKASSNNEDATTIGDAEESLDDLDNILSAEDLESAADDEALLEEFRAAEADEPSMESTLAEMGEDTPSEGQSLLDQTLEDLGELEDDDTALDASLGDLDDDTFEEEEAMLAAPTPLHKKTSSTAMPSAGEGSLTLQVSGAMTLKLQYEDQSHSIEVVLQEDGVVIRMQDGAEFRIPHKRAA